MKEPLVNIVIITCNQFAYVSKCINSVLKGKYKNIKFFIVDNNSDINKFNAFKKIYGENKNTKIFRLSENKGFAGGCNYAIKKIKKGYIVLLNDDTEVSTDWLNPIISYMEKNPDVGACQPKIRSAKNREYFEYAGAAGGWMDVFGFPFCRGRIFFTYEKDEGQYDSIADLVWCSGCCLVTRVEVIKKVGMLDEIFFIYGEESDLCWRMHFYGYRLVLIPSSVIYHHGSGTMQKMPYKKIFFHHRNGLILLFKNYTLKELFLYIPGRIFFDFLAIWFYLFKSKIIFNAVAVIAAYLDFFRLIPEIIKRRKNAAFKNNKNKKAYPLYKRSIVIDYYLLGKRKFSSLSGI